MRMRRLPPALHEKIVSFYQDVWIQKQGARPRHRVKYRVRYRVSTRRSSASTRTSGSRSRARAQETLAKPVRAALMAPCLLLPLPLLAPDGAPGVVLWLGACSAPAGGFPLSASDSVACQLRVKSTMTATLFSFDSGRVRMQSGARTSCSLSYRRRCAARWPACCCWARCAAFPPSPSAPPPDVQPCGRANGPIVVH